MRFRFLSFSAIILAACSDDEGPWSNEPGTPPSYASPGADSGQDAVSSGWLTACGGMVHQLAGGLCSQTERTATAADESALGFAAEALLQLVRGEHRAQVAWQVDGEPSARSSELVLTVQPQGEVRFIDQALASTGRSETFTFGNTGGRYYNCGDQLAVDAELSLVMPDGTLNETIQATIVAESGHHARVLAKVPSSSVVGTLRTAIEREGADQLTLALGISDLGTGLEGSLGASRSRVSANVERGTPCSTLGSFYLVQGCPMGAYPLLAADDEVVGLSFAGALQRLNATSPTTLEDTGAALSLTFSAEPTKQCVSIDTPATLPSVLTFPGQVTIESNDGRVGGSLEVQLTAEAVGGELQVVKAYSEYLVPDPSGLAELAPSYAIHEPLSWSSLEMGGFDFQVEAREDGSGGLLRAIGGSLSCQGTRPCEEVCPGPGCTVSPAEKWAVRWGELVLGTDLSLRGP